MTGLNAIVDLFEEEKLVKICAPMVRYSKLEFRSLVRKYDCDLCFTPMIMADSFVQSTKAREIGFQTNEGDRPLIVQFAANNNEDFVSAAEIVAPYCDGIDLNCGCPQRWAMQDGYGSALLTKPESIKDMVLQLRNRIPKPFSISIKIRILNDLKKTIDLCRGIEAAGATFITVHGRTPKQRCQPVNIEAFKEIRKSVRLPLVANGDVKTLKDAERLQKLTGYNGVMSARGILQNPALYAGYDKTPISCVEDWLSLSLTSELPFACFHHHLVFMLEKILDKAHRRVFNALKDSPSVIKYLSDHLSVKVPSHLKWSTNNKVDDCPTEIPNILPIADIRTTETNTEDFLEGSHNLFDS